MNNTCANCKMGHISPSGRLFPVYCSFLGQWCRKENTCSRFKLEAPSLSLKQAFALVQTIDYDMAKELYGVDLIFLAEKVLEEAKRIIKQNEVQGANT